MEYLEFTESIRKSVSDQLGNDKKVTIREVLKNNGIRLKGLLIASKDHSASPTIYLERFYDRYLHGDPMEEITDTIVSIYSENTIGDESIPDLFDDYEKARKDLYLKAVNKEKNGELLSDVPHIDFLDLSLIPYVLIRQIRKMKASVIIHNDMVDHWKVAAKQILADAMKNMIDHYGYELMPMQEMLKQMLQEEDIKTLGKKENAMYVLLSPGMQYCAALMAVDSVMKNVAEQLHSDIVILPSSIHELIVIPSSTDRDWKQLDELVKSVNETSVSDEDILSDHSYLYKRGIGYVTA